MKLTEKETYAIKCFKENDIVSDNGWLYEYASTWVSGSFLDSYQEEYEAKGFPGVMSSLCKKGIFWSDGKTVGLTDRGREIAKTIPSRAGLDTEKCWC